MPSLNAGQIAAITQDQFTVDVVPSTGSTNVDLVAAAARGAADYSVLFAEEQTGGVGRLGRSWVSPAGKGLYLSVLLRPGGVPPKAVGSLAAVAGLALLEVTKLVGVQATLKWPNDVLAGGGKLAGVLSELVPSDETAVVLGIGLNVFPMGDVPPGPGDLPATSLAESGVDEHELSDFTATAGVLLHELGVRERAWREAGGDLERAGLLNAYRVACSTLGTQVRISLPGDKTLEGRAVDVDPAGQLVVETADGQRTTVFAGDVIHLR